MDNNNSGKKGLNPLQILLAAILILAILAGGLYINNNNKQESKTATKASDAAANSNAKYVFKELGVQVTLPEDLKDLKYSVSSPSGASADFAILRLTTDEYTKLANKCLGTPENTEQNFANIIKSPLTGNAPPLESLKKFDDFYIGNLGASVKNAVCQNQATKNSFEQLNATLNDALKQAFSSATKTQ